MKLLLLLLLSSCSMFSRTTTKYDNISLDNGVELTDIISTEYPEKNSTYVSFKQKSSAMSNFELIEFVVCSENQQVYSIHDYKEKNIKCPNKKSQK